MKTTTHRTTLLPRARRQTHQTRHDRRRPELRPTPTVAALVVTVRDLLQAAENALLNPRATMHERGEVAARIACHLADTAARRRA